MWFRYLKTVAVAASLAVAATLGGCGGGGDTPPVDDHTPGTSYSISGKVALSNGTGVAGVAISLGGAGTDTKTTGADGSYTFSGLNAGSYTVTASKSAYTFNPTGSHAVTITDSSVSDLNFTATADAGSGGVVITW